MSDIARVIFSVNFASMEKDMWQLNGGTANMFARGEQESEIFIFLEEKVGKLFDEFFSKYLGGEALKLFKVITTLDILTIFVNKKSGGSLGHIFYMQIFDTLIIFKHIGVTLSDKESDKLDASVRLLVGKKSVTY